MWLPSSGDGSNAIGAWKIDDSQWQTAEQVAGADDARRHVACRGKRRAARPPLSHTVRAMR
jgi:hypothetical protein